MNKIKEFWEKASTVTKIIIIVILIAVIFLGASGFMGGLSDGLNA